MNARVLLMTQERIQSLQNVAKSVALDERDPLALQFVDNQMQLVELAFQQVVKSNEEDLENNGLKVTDDED